MKINVKLGRVKRGPGSGIIGYTTYSGVEKILSVRK